LAQGKQPLRDGLLGRIQSRQKDHDRASSLIRHHQVPRGVELVGGGRYAPLSAAVRQAATGLGLPNVRLSTSVGTSPPPTRLDFALSLETLRITAQHISAGPFDLATAMLARKRRIA